MIHKNRFFILALSFAIGLFSPSIVYAHESSATSEGIVQAAMTLGLTPESLASMGVSPTGAETALDRLDEEYSQFELILDAQETEAEARQIVIESNSLLRQDPDDLEAAAALEQGTSTASSASSLASQRRQALIDELLDGIVDSATIDVVLNREPAISRLPAAYRLAVTNSDEADDLLWAIKTAASADARGDTPNTEASQILNTAHSQTDVNLALIRVQQYSTAIENAMNSWAASN